MIIWLVISLLAVFGTGIFLTLYFTMPKATQDASRAGAYERT